MTQPSARPAGRWHYWGVPAAALMLLAALHLSGANQDLFLGINHFSAYTGDALWANLTILGNGTVALALALAVVGRRPAALVPVILAAIITAVAVNGLKDLFHAARPPAVLAADLFHVIGPAYGSRSFPSGHTATAFAFAGVVSLVVARPAVTAALILAATAVGLSRIVVGVHWPQDVLGGAAVGWLCAVAGVLLAERWRAGRRPGVRRGLMIPLFVAALLLLWPGLTVYRSAMILQYIIAAVTLAAGIASLRRPAGRRAREDDGLHQ